MNPHRESDSNSSIGSFPGQGAGQDHSNPANSNGNGKARIKRIPRTAPYLPPAAPTATAEPSGSNGSSVPTQDASEATEPVESILGNWWMTNDPSLSMEENNERFHAGKRKWIESLSDITTHLGVPMDSEQDVFAFHQALEREVQRAGAKAVVERRSQKGRTLKLTKASDIEPEPAEWLLEGKIPLGELSLLAGRAGIGKSTFGYTMAAEVTLGNLPGHFFGTPKNVLVAATEESWNHIIVPRLMAAGADLERVIRIEVEVVGDTSKYELSLPGDIQALREVIDKYEPALLLLDPLMSRLSAALDSHKDHPVRQALEPIARISQETRTTSLGIIHANKSGGRDALSLIMGSVAFTAVARAVLFAIKDPENEMEFLLGNPKNNNGITNLPSVRYQIVPHRTDTDKGPITSGRFVVVGEDQRSIDDVLSTPSQSKIERASKEEEIDEWLRGHMESKGGTEPSESVKKAAIAAGYSEWALHKSRDRLKIIVSRDGKKTNWTYTIPLGADDAPRSSTTTTTGKRTFVTR